MSVPYNGRPKKAPIDGLRDVFGDERGAAGLQRFHYQLHHQMPCAAADYERDTRSALLALIQGSDGKKEPPPVQSELLWVDGVVEPLWRRLPQT